MVAYLTNYILPAVVLHTGGNIYSNFDLWLHGQAEWQASSGAAQLVWTTGIDGAFVRSAIALLFVTVAWHGRTPGLREPAREAVGVHVVSSSV
jgi:hypothetical protein